MDIRISGSPQEIAELGQRLASAVGGGLPHTPPSARLPEAPPRYEIPVEPRYRQPESITVDYQEPIQFRQRTPQSEPVSDRPLETQVLEFDPPDRITKRPAQESAEIIQFEPAGKIAKAKADPETASKRFWLIALLENYGIFMFAIAVFTAALLMQGETKTAKPVEPAKNPAQQAIKNDKIAPVPAKPPVSKSPGDIKHPPVDSLKDLPLEDMKRRFPEGTFIAPPFPVIEK